MPTNSKHGCSGDAAAVTFLYCLMGEVDYHLSSHALLFFVN